jgi:hypothetical protein
LKIPDNQFNFIHIMKSSFLYLIHRLPSISI